MKTAITILINIALIVICFAINLKAGIIMLTINIILFLYVLWAWWYYKE